MCSLSLECGRTTSSWYAEFALRRRVKKSAIGSVIVMLTCQPFSPWFPCSQRACGEPGGVRGRRGREPSSCSPAGLADAGQLAAVRHLPDADPAQAELAQD